MYAITCVCFILLCMIMFINVFLCQWFVHEYLCGAHKQNLQLSFKAL